MKSKVEIYKSRGLKNEDIMRFIELLVNQNVFKPELEFTDINDEDLLIPILPLLRQASNPIFFSNSSKVI